MNLAKNFVKMLANMVTEIVTEQTENKPPKSEWWFRTEHIEGQSEVIEGFAGDRGFYVDPRGIFDQLPKGALFYVPAENRVGKHRLRRKI